MTTAQEEINIDWWEWGQECSPCSCVGNKLVESLAAICQVLANTLLIVELGNHGLSQ